MEQCDILLRGPAANKLQGSKLLAYANNTTSSDGEADAWLCSIFGVEHQQLAPFSAIGNGLDASSGYWLCSDPVHLALMRDFFVLQGTPHDLTPQHAQQLVAALNQHFTADDMQWFAPHPARWYLRLGHKAKDRLQITAISKQQALGRKVSKQLDSASGAAVLNEIQMLLHQHGVNAEREQAGLLPVNSLWLWAGGEYASSLVQPYTVVMANEPLLQGLAGERCRPLPESAAHLSQQGACLVVLDDMDASQLEQKWAAPLLSMVKANKVQNLLLHLEQEQSVISYRLRRQDLWKFWRLWKR
jgi:hypothetical protein